MRNLWIHESYFRTWGRLGAAPFRALLAAAESVGRNQRKPAEIAVGDFRVVVASLPETNTVAVLHVDGPGAGEPARGEWRSVFVARGALEEAAADDKLEAILDRWADVSNIDDAAPRRGLKHRQQGDVRCIFIAGDYWLLHFVTPLDGFSIVLGCFPGDLWKTHGSSSQVRQPDATDLHVAQKVHAAATALPGLERRMVVATEAPPPPLVDSWITLNRLREMQVVEQEVQRRVLAVRDESELYALIGVVPDDAYELLESLWRSRELRKAEKKLDLAEVYSTDLFSSVKGRTATTFAEAQRLLTDRQKAVVELDQPKPIRLKGGPGTGKTFTAVLRAGWLLEKAREEQRPLRLGFFVFNRELGEKVVEEFKRLGFDAFFERGGEEQPQRLVVASLLDWGERFLDLEALRVEPLAPYRADNVDRHRQAALELAIEEARRSLVGDEYRTLWAAFDAKSRHGLREIEMEISQFIKARDITDLQTYLAEKRPPGWWLADTDKAFRKFIWEVAKVYDRTLRELGFMDADDLVNDCLKEVAKHVWQQFRKPTQGFDYLIVDEAQDFFRNQLTLVSKLAKEPTGLMLCYDEMQAVYSRYPNLRDLGFDTDSNFFGRNLERNFRSTKQIVEALRTLFARYPTATLQASWGDYAAGADGESGPRPVASGFSTEEAMLQQIVDELRRAFDGGFAPSDCAVLAFDAGLRERIGAALGAAGVQVSLVGAPQRKRSARAVSVADGKRAKGQQYEFVIVAGVDRDSLPDFTGARTDIQRESRREDDLREFIVAASRARRQLHFVWSGAEPSEFVAAMGGALDRRG